MKLAITLPRIAATITFSLAASMAHSISYNITALGSLSNQGSQAYGLNESGQVVGKSYNASTARNEAVLWSNGTIQSLGVQGVARAVNNSGVVVGENGIDNFQQPNGRAFQWSNGSYQDLGDLGGSNASAYDINDAGQIAGVSEISTPIPGQPEQYTTHAFRYENGTMTDMGGYTVETGYSRAHGINGSGVMTGRASEIEFLGSKKHVATYGINGDFSYNTTGFFYSTGQDINNLGIVVGNGYNAQFQMEAIVMDENGDFTFLGTFGGNESRAFSVNDNGAIVGFARDTENDKKAMISYDGVSMLDLNDLVTNMEGWSELNVANAINENGEIVGYGINALGQEEAFLLSPVAVPVPAAAYLFGSSLLLLVFNKRKRRG